MNNNAKSSTSNINLQNLLSSNKFIPVYLDRRNVDPLQLPPYSVELHLTSTCNYNCYHCSYSLRNKKDVFIKKNIVKTLIEDLSENVVPKGVYFSGGGEPTTLKGWDSNILTLNDKGIKVALVTNGSQLRQQHFESLQKLNYIAISIYSIKEETYRKITGSNNYEISFSLPSMIKSAGDGPVVGARCVINENNYTEVAQIYTKALESGYDYIIFIPEIDYEKRGIALSSDILAALTEMTSTNEFDDTRTNLNRLKFDKFNYYSGYEDVSEMDCQAIRLRTNAFVNYDGGIYLCQPHIGNEKFCIGNLNSDRLSTIWNSPRHLEVIEALSKEYRANRCINCRSIGNNKAAANFIMLPDHTPIKILKDSFL